MKIIPPLSTTEGRRYAQALPQLGKEETGTVMGVGHPEAFIAYRWHFNVDPKTGEDKSNWAYLYTSDSYTRGLSTAIESKHVRNS